VRTKDPEEENEEEEEGERKKESKKEPDFSSKLWSSTSSDPRKSSSNWSKQTKEKNLDLHADRETSIWSSRTHARPHNRKSNTTPKKPLEATRIVKEPT
jgi:hypothetical protein